MVVARLSGWGSKSKSLKHWDKEFEYLVHLYCTVRYRRFRRTCLVFSFGVKSLSSIGSDVKGTVWRDFRHLFFSKSQPGPHRNSQRRFSKFFLFSQRYSRKCAKKSLSLTTLKRCQQGSWIHQRNVGMVVDYANTMSALSTTTLDTNTMLVWSLTTPTRCRPNQRLRGHNVIVVNDYADTR